jgi:hypothetical protein
MPLGHLRATRRRLGQDRKFDIGHQQPSPPSFRAQRLRLLLAQHQGPDRGQHLTQAQVIGSTSAGLPGSSARGRRVPTGITPRAGICSVARWRATQASEVGKGSYDGGAIGTEHMYEADAESKQS